MYASCGTTAEKSVPGFAVPDSVHQVKLVDPRKFPLRCTLTCADGSLVPTSTVSAANSIFDAPVPAAEAAATGCAVTRCAAAAAGALVRWPTVAGGGTVADDAVGAAAGAATGEAATGEAATGGAATSWPAADEAVGAGAGEAAAGACCEGGTGMRAGGGGAEAMGCCPRSVDEGGVVAVFALTDGAAMSAEGRAGLSGTRTGAVESMLGSVSR